MVLGTAISLVGGILFAISSTDTNTGYYQLALYFVLSSVGGGMAYVAWMAAFTETVEKHNPAATATGLAVWGWILRIVVTASLAIFTLIVPATSTLVDKATPITEMQAENPQAFAIITSIDPQLAAKVQADPADGQSAATLLGQVATAEGASADEVRGVQSVVTGGQAAAAQAIAPATLAALQANPLDQAAGAAAVGQIVQGLGVDQATALQLLRSLASPDVQANLQLAAKYTADLQAAGTAFTPEQLSYLQANGADVAAAAQDNAGQWQTWWWVCVAGQLVFLPFVFIMPGAGAPKAPRRRRAGPRGDGPARAGRALLEQRPVTG